MEKNCDNCIFCYKPTGIKDYFDKTLTPPNICKWGVEVFKHEFWLCSSPDVSKIDHTNNSLIYKPCEKTNKRGTCEYFKTGNAEDIVPSSIEISPTEELPDKIKTNTTVVLEAIVTPAIIPAKTEEVIIEKEVPVTDSEGNPLYDGNNDPITEIKEVPETIIIEPEHVNTQDINYSYQWYKNGRKLFKETNNTITVDTSTESIDSYYCVLYQDIVQNGDGGRKHAETTSNAIVLCIVQPTTNTIVLNVKTGSVEITLPVPFTVSDYEYPATSGPFEDWTILSAITSKEDLTITTEIIPKMTIETTEGISVTTEENIIRIRAVRENLSGTIKFSWESIE